MLTCDPKDPRLGHGSDDKPVPQNPVYLVSCDNKEFVRPVRQTYTHIVCGEDTTMGIKIAETYAKNPKFYGSTYCVTCSKHLPVAEFVWKGTQETVGS